MIKHKTLYMYVAISIYILYLLLGNLARVIPTPFFPNNISILELVLYLMVTGIIFFNWKHYYVLVKNNREILFLTIVIVFFSLLGLAYHKGENISSFIYSVRLTIQIISIFVLGDILNKLFKKDLMKLVDFLLIIFIAYTIIGWIIYFNFPNATDFWVFLNKHNITFAGDPHIHRFMGGFLDPNFTSNIIVFPILLCIYKYLYNEKRQYLYLIIGNYLLLCMIYTYSRSGLLGLFISVGFICLLNIKRIFKNLKDNIKRTIPIVGSLLILFTILNLPVMQLQTQGSNQLQQEDVQTQDEHKSPVDRFSGRFINIGQDESALHRFNDFVIGARFLTRSPYIFLFGIGYNYIQYDLGTYLSALDSSVLNTIISFGIIGTILIMIFIFLIMKKIVGNAKIYDKKIAHYLVAYFISSIIISNFNNLLYYQYFIISFGSFLMYFYLINEYTIKE